MTTSLHRLVRLADWPLSAKVLLAFGVLALLPVILVGQYGYGVAREAIMEAQVQALTSRADGLASRLDLLLVERRRHVVRLAEERFVKAFAAVRDLGLPDVQRGAQAALDGVAQSSAYFDVYLMNPEGEVLLSTTDNVGQNFGFRPYFQAAMAGNAYISDVSISVDLGRPVMYFSAPVWADAGHVAAVAVLRVRAEELWALVEAERDSLAPGSTAMLFDEYGMHLAHASDRSLIFKALVPLDAQVEAQLLAEHRLGTLTKIESANSAELAEGIHESDGRRHFLYRLASGDERFYAGTAHMQVKPWVIVESVPESAFLAPIDRLRWASRLTAAAVGLLAIALAALTTRHVVNPLSELSAASRRLALGELDQPIAGRPVQRRDEIGTLLEGFEAMRAGRARAEAGLRRRAGELEAIAEVGGLVTAGGDLPTTLETLARKIAEAAGFEGVGICLYDAEKQTVSFPAVFASRPMKLLQARMGATVRLDEAPTMQRLLRDGRYLHSRNPQNDPRLGQRQCALAREDGVQTLLTWPLFYGGELIGALDLVSTRWLSFSPEDLGLLSTLADQTAVAVQNAWLFFETHRLLRETSLLLDLSAALRTLLRKEEMLPAILHHMQAGLQVDGVTVLTLDSTNGTFTADVGSGDFETLAGVQYDLRVMPPACAMHTGEPCFGQAECPLLPQAGRPYSVACVPVRVGERILGAIHAGARRPEAFTPPDLPVLKGIADIAANALHRAALYDEVRLYKDAFYSTADAVAITDLQGRILDVNPAFQQITGFSREEAIGHKPSLLQSRHSTPDFYRRMWDQILERGYWAGELINRRKNGEEWDSSLTISTIKDERGRPVAYLGLNRDITERKRREREREALLSVASALRTAATRTEMLPIFLDRVTTLVEADGAALALSDPATGEAAVEMGAGVWQAWTGERLAPGEGITGHVIATGRPYLTADLRTDPRAVRPDIVGDVQAAACVPLIAQEQTLGVLWVGRQTAISDDELRLLSAIGDMAANAIHRATLHEQTQQRLQRLSAVHNIGLAISASVDVHVTLNVLLEQALGQLDVDAAAVLLLSPHSQILEYAAGRGFNTRLIAHSHQRLGEGQTGQAALTRRMVRVPDLARADPPFFRTELVKAEGFVSYFAVPLVAKGKVGGVLELYHRSPLTPTDEWLRFLEMLGTQAGLAIDNAQLFDGLQRANLDLALAYDTTLEGWARALELRDRETEGHTRRVTELTVRLARLMGIQGEALVHVRRGALLHDIGKMGIPDSVLLKPGDLTRPEWDLMKQHPTLGCQMLKDVRFLHGAVPIVLYHHEKFDGSGYPEGLAGHAIPLPARIFAIVDAYDAMTNDRPYRKAMTHEEALAEIERSAGSHFDPAVVEALLRALRPG